MCRYLIEREFPDGLSIPQDEGGASLCRKAIENNAEDGVTWVHSYITPIARTRSASTTGPRLRPSAAPRPVTNCLSRGSPEFASSIRTSTGK